MLAVLGRMAFMIVEFAWTSATTSMIWHARSSVCDGEWLIIRATSFEPISMSRTEGQVSTMEGVAFRRSPMKTMLSETVKTCSKCWFKHSFSHRIRALSLCDAWTSPRLWSETRLFLARRTNEWPAKVMSHILTLTWWYICHLNELLSGFVRLKQEFCRTGRCTRSLVARSPDVWADVLVRSLSHDNCAKKAE